MSKIQKGKETKGREEWSSQLGFLMAAIGSAIGLGNIWRFPAVAYENGGGAFLVPYLIALFTAGIPALLLDYSIGHRFRGSPPLSFRRLHKKAEVIGWWQVLISFIIMVYYAVIIAWALQYMVYSVNQAWGHDSAKFFNESFLQLSEPGTVSAMPVWSIFIALVLVWVSVLVIIGNGIQKGLERANKFFLPLLVVLFAAMVIRAITLPGAFEGLNVFFTPDWSKLYDGKVWIAAYSQIFYSLSICFGIMITYSSYLGRRSNLSGSGYVAAFANSSFELLAGIGVFAALGFMAVQQGVTVDKLEGISGIGLSFVTFPKIISMMPGGSYFGVLFFASLVLAGVTSLISLVQVVASAFEDKVGWSAYKASLIIGTVAMVISLALFSTHSGLFALDVIDAYINEIGIVSSAIIMCVFVTVGVGKLPELRKHLNSVSSIPTGKWWEVMVGFLLPALLSSMFITGLVRFISQGHGGYPTWYVLVFGWGAIAVGLVSAIVMTIVPWKKDENFIPIELED
ncbi:sodium-dependent transporter [Actinomyces sp. zg-332]|uniref:sodium-dependent transporter n=1 Tax=Actinomyces sp. zg-332 TaxID=2708340 RepID=UPI0014233A14|nr:sodium-dependent transporter [Actinomyces sp. zg-332]QPK94477.1 sodium-dependent transporter [Actinomyces sp. zg-332]